jgi:hypothetical protein
MDPFVSTDGGSRPPPPKKMRKGWPLAYRGVPTPHAHTVVVRGLVLGAGGFAGGLR